MATTLLEVPAKELAQLYLRRWDIELCFEDIKTTMEMDLLRAKSPAMEVKMLTMYAIAHNLVCLLMQQAVRATGDQGVGEHSMRLSFKGALDATLRFAAEMDQGTLQGMAQSATKTLPHHRHRLPAKTFQTLRTQSRQTTTKTVSADDAAACGIEAAHFRQSCHPPGGPVSLIRVPFGSEKVSGCLARSNGQARCAIGSLPCPRSTSERGSRGEEDFSIEGVSDDIRHDR